MSKSNALLWLDLETTGLDYEGDDIIEVGMICTDIKLREHARASFIIWSQKKLETLHPAVQEMHTNNGLWDLCQPGSKAGNMELDVMEEFTILTTIWRQKFSDGQPLHPAGSSVHFDIAFLRAHSWDLSNLHHRHFDVSSIKMAVESVNGIYEEGREDPHRAISDLDNDLEWVREWRRDQMARGVE